MTSDHAPGQPREFSRADFDRLVETRKNWSRWGADVDALPNGLDVVHSVHAAIYLFGIALVDNAALEPLVEACGEEGRDEFMLTVSPLPVKGGTGSPANPLAMF